MIWAGTKGRPIGCAPAAHVDDGHLRQALASMPGHIPAVGSWAEVDVRYHSAKAGSVRIELGHGLPAIGRDNQLEAFLAQRLLQQRLDERLVLDEEEQNNRVQRDTPMPFRREHGGQSVPLSQSPVAMVDIGDAGHLGHAESVATTADHLGPKVLLWRGTKFQRLGGVPVRRTAVVLSKTQSEAPSRSAMLRRTASR